LVSSRTTAATIHYFLLSAMAAGLLRAMACVAMCTAMARGEVELGAADLPSDEVCAADDAGCALSLRQLRGEKLVKELPEETVVEAAPVAAEVAPVAAEVALHDASPDAEDFSTEAAAGVASQIAAHVVKKVMADAAESSADAAGGSNATIEAAGGACLGQVGWDKDFTKHAYRCALRSMANAYRSGVCMAQVQHVSGQCGACMGWLVHCGTKCMRECCYGRCSQAATCVECGDRNCGQGFTECAGYAPPKA